jgi:ABC-2 type transport system permease protein
MTAVFRRELAAYFITPIGYVYLTAFYLLAGYQYAVLLLSGSADMAAEFSFLYTAVLLLTPVLTMRLFSEERRQKTDQLLFSAPVTLGGITAGKYFAAAAVYLLGIAVTLPQAAVLSLFGEVNWALVAGNFAGMALVGMAAIALCMFVSAHTESQMVAAIGGFAAVLAALGLSSAARLVPAGLLRTLLQEAAFYSRYYRLTMGLVRASDVFFFASFGGAFFFLTARTLERRRWGGQ